MSDLLNGKAWLGEYEDAVQARLARFAEERVVARLWAQDGSLWSDDAVVQKSIVNRLGWLSSPLTMLARREELDCVRGAPYRDVVLLGMGGSSLAPEVFQRVLGNGPDAPRLHVLDNTTADAVQGLRAALDLSQTLFVIASKSGGTLETKSFGDYFYEQSGKQGKQFIAITDAASQLAAEAEERGYAALFLNQQDIGGRYSALSFFGLLPATLIGVSIERLLAHAAEAIRHASAATPPAQNEALVLGIIMGELAAAGRNKLTFLASPTLGSFGDWAEQLIAESTGKMGRGVLPIVGERAAGPESYGPDRLFVYMRLEGEGTHDERVAALRVAGHPVIQFDLQDPYHLGRHFFLWEFATAIAGVVLGINPFDEPNVTESKNNTKRLLQQFLDEGAFPLPQASLDAEGVRVSGTVMGDSPEDALRAFVEDTAEREYVAILAYVPMTQANEAALRDLQAAIRDRSRAATTLGFGPRFLHSTGQYHKGGVPEGRFLQIVADDSAQVAIPGAPYAFSALATAQALGDLEALEQRDLPTLRLHLSGNVAETIARLVDAL
ncbi:MAG: glucose-6-phosphate isomerase [Ardenticatenales bacterium]|nr:glucose-6-phosphate isomerase [Ardenticatenales bacterium]